MSPPSMGRPTGAPNAFGAPGVDLARIRDADVVVLGVPYDGAAPGRPGAAAGPRLLREASLAAFAYRLDPRDGEPDGALDLDRRRVALRGVRFGDAGDVRFDPDAAPDAVAAEVAAAVAAVRRAGARPLIFGGDHSIAFGVASGLAADGPLGLLHLDAHLDVAPAEGADLTHATWATHARRLPHVACLAQLGPRGLQPLGAATRAVAQAEPGGHAAAFDRALAALGVDRLWSARDLTHTPPEAVRAALPAGLRWMLSLDVDVLAPADAPETGVPVALGPSAAALSVYLEALVRGLDVVSVDVTEVAGPAAAAAALAVVLPALDAITSR